MRLPTVVLLTLLSFSTTFSQAKPILEDKGYFGLHRVDDRILQHEYLERENQLLLVGYKNLQLLDLTNFKVIETRPINLPYSDVRAGYDYRDWTISPDGRRMLLLGLNEGHTKTKTETKQAAWVLDLQTAKRVALLDHPDQIRKAWWSKNGKTLVTMDTVTKTLNVSFWDGETFAHRHSMTLENVTWIFLTTSNQFAKIFDSRTGELVQIVEEPQLVIDLMGKPRKLPGNTVLSADWSKDGKALYVFSANRHSVSLWKLIED